ncbi:MAG: PilW family protein [Rhodocyclaceae bacterium]|nr:PilW family protein [Rhodocyclaceae bacterium]
MMTPNRILGPSKGGARITVARPSQSGFTLIELMVAVVLGLLIMAALSTIFVNISRTNNEMAKTNAQIENGRFAMQILQDDIVHAGYWGGYVPQFDDMTATVAPTDAPTDTPLPTPVSDLCRAFASWNAAYQSNLIAIPVQSYDDTPAGCAAVVTNKKANTDVLVVRHVETCLPGAANCEADTAGKLYFQPSFCELEIAGGQRYKFDNTTGFTTLGTGLHQRNCVGSGSPQALPIASGAFAAKRKFISNIYYVRDYALTVGDGIPTLMLSQFDAAGGVLSHQPAVPLIEGIEGFMVEFGIDSIGDAGTVVDYTQAATWADPLNRVTLLNRGDGAPDGAFVRCTTAVPCTATQLANVVAVKLYVLARNKESTSSHADVKTYALGATTLGPFTGDQAKYKRHVFSTTVRLTNISGRRETP